MDQERMHLQFTKTVPRKEVTTEYRTNEQQISFNCPSEQIPPTRSNLVICAISPATDKIYSDLTGKFPIFLH